MNNLTTEEQNLIKDIIKAIGRDDDFATEFAKGIGMEIEDFDLLADSIFMKLCNGRLVVVNS